MPGQNSRYRFTLSMLQCGFRETGKSDEQIIGTCREAGFAGVEGWFNLFEGRSDKETERLGARFREAGLVIETFHLPFQDPVRDDIATLYETDRRKVEALMLRSIDQAALLGATIGIVHPTTRKGYPAEVEGIEHLMSALGRTLEAMLRHGEQYRFRLAVENMLPYTGGRLGCSIDHLKSILARHDHPNLGFCFDTGHALVSHGDRALGVLRFMGERLIALHLADNAGDRDSHLAPGHGRFCWPEFFRELGQRDFRSTACVEAPPFDHGPDYSLEAWKGLHRDMCLLAEGGGLDSRNR